MIRNGPPLPPLIFIGSAITENPLRGKLVQIGDVFERRNVFRKENAMTFKER